MPITIRCPRCQAMFPVDERAGGSVMTCQCGASIRVPIMAEFVSATPSPGAPMPAPPAGSPLGAGNPFADVNPYAPPQSAPHADWREAAEKGGGIWQSGNLLIVHRSATFPDICVKTNEPAEGVRLRRKLHWHPPLIALSVLISPLIYIILAAIFTKRAKVEIGLTRARLSRRRLFMAFGWLGGLTGFAAFVLSIAMIDQFDIAPVMLFFSFFGGIIAVLIGSIGSRVLHPAKITDDLIYLKGCHRDFLKRFPTWPYPR